MAWYAARRVLALIPTLIGLSLVVAVVVRLVPGTVVEQMLGLEGVLDKETMASLRRFFGLDEAFHRQYLRWLWGVLTGDLGRSWRSGQPIAQILLSRFSVTAELGLLSVLVSAGVGIPLGVLAAVRHRTALDGMLRVGSLLSLSMPVFWQGSMLLLLFSLWLRWLPPTVYVPWHANLWVNVQIMLLPAVCLGTASSAVILRMTRANFLDVMRSDYVRTARAKGLSERLVLARHALKNALIPIITVLGLQLGYILGGVVVVEEVFTLPGVGRLVLHGIAERDYPVVQAAVFFIAAAAMLVNLMVDLLYGLFDPRIRYG